MARAISAAFLSAALNVAGRGVTGFHAMPIGAFNPVLR